MKNINLLEETLNELTLNKKLSKTAQMLVDRIFNRKQNVMSKLGITSDKTLEDPDVPAIYRTLAGARLSYTQPGSKDTTFMASDSSDNYQPKTISTKIPSKISQEEYRGAVNLGLLPGLAKKREKQVVVTSGKNKVTTTYHGDGDYTWVKEDIIKKFLQDI